jgi:hypothetical protein
MDPDPLVRGSDPYQNVTDPEDCSKVDCRQQKKKLQFPDFFIAPCFSSINFLN